MSKLSYTDLYKNPSAYPEVFSFTSRCSATYSQVSVGPVSKFKVIHDPATNRIKFFKVLKHGKISTKSSHPYSNLYASEADAHLGREEALDSLKDTLTQKINSLTQIKDNLK